MKRRHRFLHVLALGVAVVLSIPALAAAQTTHFFAQLTGGQETPGNNSASWGLVFGTLDHATGGVVLDVWVWNMPSGVTAAHIHAGGFGVAGPIVLPLAVPRNISNDFQVRLTHNLSELTPQAEQGVRSAEDLAQAIDSPNGVTYVNIHSAAHPAGEIRGQIFRVDPDEFPRGSFPAGAGLSSATLERFLQQHLRGLP